MSDNPQLTPEVTPEVTLEAATDSISLVQLNELQQLYDHAPCGYHSLDENGLFIQINQTELIMLGYSRDEIVGCKKFPDLLTPESQKTFLVSFPQFKQQGWIRDLGFEMVRKDGTILPVSISATAIRDAAGNYIASRSVVIDISERVQFKQERLQAEADRKQAELARERFLSIAADLQVIMTQQGDFQWVSPAFEQVLGWTATEMTCRPWAEFVHPEDNAEPLTENANLHKGHETFTFENRYRHKDGSYRWLLWKAQYYPQEQLIYGAAVDISERKKLEAQFLRAQRLESLGTLASGIAHDLNNVLTPIIGIVQLLPLRIGPLDERNTRLLQTLEASARRGADLVKQILSFTRGIEGKPTNTQVSHLLAEIQKIILQTFPKNIELTMALDANLWMIAADATLLHQVFMNLCVNARDAMPNGGTLQISAENVVLDENYVRMNLDAQAGSYVVITIADTGIGIPPETMDRIFDPFFTTKEIGKGTGLGLSTVLGIIKSHHGFVNVYSEVNKGSRFKMYLPATDTQEFAPIAEPPPRLGAGELILIVDDEVAIQDITQATLETHGYQSITANDGVEAIALYAERKHDISAVLLDLMMPSLDSITIIRTLCRLNPDVKIIAMSGLATNESVTRTMSEGVQGFLAKPFTANELLDLLSQIFSRNG
jgi:two-component system, cell cycle sensor histidine kinase and response regulator CckA